MADPGFPRVGNLLFYIICAENCIKLKEFGRGEACVPGAPPDPPLMIHGNKHVQSGGVYGVTHCDFKSASMNFSGSLPFFKQVLSTNIIHISLQ